MVYWRWFIEDVIYIFTTTSLASDSKFQWQSLFTQDTDKQEFNFCPLHQLMQSVGGLPDPKLLFVNDKVQGKVTHNDITSFCNVVPVYPSH